FIAEHDLEGWLQPRGPDSIEPVPGTSPRALGYGLPEFGLWRLFSPTEFTQVNAAVNRVMVARAVSLLAPAPGDVVADLFCGLGNFTLALATRARRVIGIDGALPLVERAAANARHNGFGSAQRPDHVVDFQVADLFGLDEARWQALGPVDRCLIDPPRDGALAVARTLATTPAPPKRVVYVSCNPATLARDVAILVHEGGWRLDSAGVVNMFPQTSHVESIAVLEPARSE
ncbi:MAG: 23S rRNA (uracil(1939)-C(5))-methyltransferase, partial [Burkholderiaceae bacterium]